VAKPLVSVILPTRDRATLLPRAVASVLAQTDPDFELIIVDNSTAGRGLESSGYSGFADPRVRIIAAPEAAHAGAARNAGLVVAAGEWTTFLDDDDAYVPEKLAVQRDLAMRTGAPLVLCGARFHLRGRTRVRHINEAVVSGDALLVSAGTGTPFLFHRRTGVRFNPRLFAGEDLHYAQQLLVEFGLAAVPVATQPLVDVYQDAPLISRTNTRALAGWRAARLVWWEFGRRYSRAARRRFLVRALVARAKLQGRSARVLALLPVLLSTGGAGDLRFWLNALAVSSGCGRGRWIT